MHAISNSHFYTSRIIFLCESHLYCRLQQVHDYSAPAISASAQCAIHMLNIEGYGQHAMAFSNQGFITADLCVSVHFAASRVDRNFICIGVSWRGNVVVHHKQTNLNDPWIEIYRSVIMVNKVELIYLNHAYFIMFTFLGNGVNIKIKKSSDSKFREAPRNISSWINLPRNNLLCAKLRNQFGPPSNLYRPRQMGVLGAAVTTLCCSSNYSYHIYRGPSLV